MLCKLSVGTMRQLRDHELCFGVTIIAVLGSQKNGLQVKSVEGKHKAVMENSLLLTAFTFSHTAPANLTSQAQQQKLIKWVLHAWSYHMLPDTEAFCYCREWLTLTVLQCTVSSKFAQL